MSLTDSQFGNRCADLVLNLNECFEANGLYRGKKVCKIIQDDLKECNYWYLREQAAQEVMRIRYKKMLTGDLPKKEAYMPKAPANSFNVYPNHR